MALQPSLEVLFPSSHASAPAITPSPHCLAAQRAPAWAQTHPDSVLVTSPNASRDRLDPIVTACARAGIDCRFVRRELALAPGAVLGRAAE